MFARSEPYSGSSQTSVMVFFVNLVKVPLVVNYICIKAPSPIFEKVLNTPLLWVWFWLKFPKTITCLNLTIEPLEKVWHKFRANNKDSKTTLFTLFWCLYCWAWTYFILFFYSSVHNIWEFYEVLVQFSFTKSKTELYT